MAVGKADEYKHQNDNRAFVDSNFLRGGARAVANRAELYALTAKADQLKEFVSVVRVLSDNENGGQKTKLLLIDDTKIGQSAGWELDGGVVNPPAPAVPGLVGNLQALGMAAGSVALNWMSAAANGAAVSNHFVRHRPQSGGTWTVIDTASAALTRVVTGLTIDTAYEFQVAAVNSVGAGAYSASAMATPTGWNGIPGYVVPEGDSLTYSAGTGGQNSYPMKMQGSFGSNFIIDLTRGFSGNTSEAIAGYTQQIYDQRTTRAPAGAPMLVILLCGINDIIHAAPGGPQGSIQRILQIHQDYHALGVDTICVTLTPAGPGWGVDAFIDEVNIGLRAGWEDAGCFRLADANTIEQFTPVTSTFYTDELHFTEDGNTVLMEFLRPFVVEWANMKQIPAPPYTNVGIGNGAPVAPVASFNPVTRVLSWAHDLGPGELEVSTDGFTAATPYAGEFVVSEGAKDAGAFQCRTRAFGSRPAGNIGYSPAIASDIGELVVLTNGMGTRRAATTDGTLVIQGLWGSGIAGLVVLPAASNGYGDFILAVYKSGGSIRFQNEQNVWGGWGAWIDYVDGQDIELDYEIGQKPSVKIAGVEVLANLPGLLVTGTLPEGLVPDTWDQGGLTVGPMYLRSTSITDV